MAGKLGASVWNVNSVEYDSRDSPLRGENISGA